MSSQRPQSVPTTNYARKRSPPPRSLLVLALLCPPVHGLGFLPFLSFTTFLLFFAFSSSPLFWSGFLACGRGFLSEIMVWYPSRFFSGDCTCERAAWVLRQQWCTPEIEPWIFYFASESALRAPGSAGVSRAAPQARTPPPPASRAGASLDAPGSRIASAARAASAPPARLRGAPNIPPALAPGDRAHDREC